MPYVICKFFLDLDPMERRQRYHQPLDAALTAAGLGEVTGGGTLYDLDNDEVIYSDVQVLVTGDVDQALGVIRATLVTCGAPQDTELLVESTDTTIRLDVH